MKKICAFKTLVRLLVIALPILIFASPAITGKATTAIKQNSEPLDKLKFITSTGIENFIKDLNESDKSGYRLEKSLNYGGEGLTQSYAAVLRLDAPNKYEYDWISSPDKKAS